LIGESADKRTFKFHHVPQQASFMVRPEKLLLCPALVSSKEGLLISEGKTRSQASETGRKVTIGLIQTDVSENTAENLKKTLDKVEVAAAKGAQIICLQELYRTRYFPQKQNSNVVGLAETVPGESTAAFAQLAKKHGIVIIVPVFEKGSDGQFYNSAVTIDADGEILGVYRKIHVPYDPLFYEKAYFASGDSGYGVYKTRYACIGILICYDQWFPEAARINVLRGADIIFYPTAIGAVKGCRSQDGDWHDAWKTVQRGHAIANGVHVAAVNRVGEEGALQFWGGSFVCTSFGKVLAEASRTKEEILIAKVDLGKNRQIREGWGFFENRRPDTYSLIVEENP
jgi:agmatine deiminase